MIHQPTSPDGFRPPNQFVPEVVSPLPCPLPCSSGLFVIYYFFFQRTHFFHWPPGQMPHQRFQRFDSYSSVSFKI